MAYSEFIFEAYHYDPATATLSLRYRFPDGPRFEEVLTFDFMPRPLLPGDSEALDRLFRLLLLVSGVSYYKAFIPKTLVCEAFPVDADTAGFLTKFYENGLGEFAYTNGISLAGHIEVRAAAVPPVMPLALALPRRSCVPIGGGKDSVVTLECLKHAGEPIVLFALGDAEPIEACVRVAGLPVIRVRRRLDGALFKLNRAGALNGHVPITGILSTIALAAAILYGCDAVAMSNEHSASAPNLVGAGSEINHQFSKSFEFEEDFSHYLARHLSGDIAYFSFLRPLTEVAIAQRFARFSEYFAGFRSCNTAFKQDRDARGPGWCCRCPKCRFVFLVLAPFVARSELIAIFGENLLDDRAQLDGFAALCGLRGHKPFECVGETGESAAIMAYLGDDRQWRDAAIVRQLNGRFPSLRQSLADYPGLFHRKHPHRVPAPYLAMLDGCG